MKKQILFIACIIVTIMLSIGAISANDSVTDSYTANSVDDTSDVSVSTSSVAESSQDSISNDGNAKSNVDDTSKVSLSSKESLESENSNSLSTDILQSKNNSGENTKKATNENTQVTQSTTPASENKQDTSSATINVKDVTKYYKGNTPYTATFLNSKGQFLANIDVNIIVNGKTHTLKTDANGVASLAINLKPGTYTITAQDPTNGLSVKSTFKILTTISATNVVKIYKDNKKFYATFLKSDGTALAKKTIKFKIKGKIHKVKTNAKGVAKLSVKSLKKGTYKIISYNKDGLTQTNTIKVIKTSSTKIVTKTYTYLTSNAKKIKATIKNSVGYTVGKGKTVRIKVNGRTYTAKTNAKGVATVKLGKLKKGSYTITYKFYRTGVYKASSATSKLLILNNNKAAYKVKSSTLFTSGQKSYFKVALTASNIPLEKRTITLNVNNKTYVKTTNSKGIVSIPIKLNAGEYVVSYSYAGESKINAKSGSTVIQVRTSESKIVPVTKIIESAVNLKSYYDSNKKLPTSVTCNEYSFTVPEFLYLMSKAIYQLGENNMADVHSIPGVSDPTSPSGDNINSEQLSKERYLTLAKNTCSFIESNGRAPNYVSTSLGKVIYEEIVDAMSRGLNFYKENKRLPNYLIISQGSTGATGNGLNFAETLSDEQIRSYLIATKNCQINDASIAKATASVTSGLTTNYAKAKAIFEYVRDKLTYTFYLNTKYGAVNTLSYKKGNCVDHTHLIVAMCRNAGIAARYVHGYCTFTSGLQVGHVWAQVYVDGKWVVADATSSRNSFGNIVNWNTKSFKLYNVYTELKF